MRVEAHGASHHVPQSLLERLRSVAQGGPAIRQHLLQPRRPLRDAQEDAVEPDHEQPGRVVPGGRSAAGDPLPHGQKRSAHRQREPSARRVPVREVAVFVGENRLERAQAHAFERRRSQDETALRPTARAGEHAAPPLHDRDLGARRHVHVVHRARPDPLRDFIEHGLES